jgi:hypothetical protein
MKARFVPTAAALRPLLLTVLAIPACSHGGHGSDSTVAFAGTWLGTWSTSDPARSGALTLQLEQVGTTVTGTATFLGHPCMETCTVACETRGHELSGRLHSGSSHVDFSGSCPESSHCSGPHHANTLTASYQVRDGSCIGEHGVIQMTPVAARSGADRGASAVGVGEILVFEAGRFVDRQPVLLMPER